MVIFLSFGGDLLTFSQDYCQSYTKNIYILVFNEERIQHIMCLYYQHVQHCNDIQTEKAPSFSNLSFPFKDKEIEKHQEINSYLITKKKQTIFFFTCKSYLPRKLLPIMGELPPQIILPLATILLYRPQHVPGMCVSVKNTHLLAGHT